jgi:hypothetical protein
MLQIQDSSAVAAARNEYLEGLRAYLCLLTKRYALSGLHLKGLPREGKIRKTYRVSA